jgi:hypothetical protein
MLETLPFVERYAWFSLPPWMKDGSDRISLYYQNGDLTLAGVAFQKGPAMPPPTANAVGSEVDMKPGLVGNGFAAGSHDLRRQPSSKAVSFARIPQECLVVIDRNFN